MTLKEKASKLKAEIGTLYYAYKDKRTPILAKLLSLIVVAYALSPIDLIPDFIPILGYLDDVILLPIGIYIALKLIPEDVVLDSRKRAIEEFMTNRKSNYIVASLIVILWISLLSMLVQKFL